MNQDQLIRFLMDNIDAEALAEANRQGSTIMYYAGVAQRFPNIQNAANPQRRVAQVAPANPVARMAVRQPAPQNEEIQEAPAPAPAPVRQAPRRAPRAGNEGDAVRVGRY